MGKTLHKNYRLSKQNISIFHLHCYIHVNIVLIEAYIIYSIMTNLFEHNTVNVNVSQYERNVILLVIASDWVHVECIAI